MTSTDQCGVLHFYHNSWERKGPPHFRLCGYSHAAASFQETSTEPPKAAEWAGRDSYYRIELAGFTELERALSIPELIAQHADVIKKEKASGVPKYYPFAEYREGLRLAQGTYLATCTTSLYGLMTEALGQADRPEVKTAAGQQQEFVEGTRRKREAYFFARNPALVREAKRHYGYRCMVCQFDFEEQYGDVGHEYIECHHLNPLSERRGEEEDEALTKLEDVAVLCANCHRMVHKTRPALSLEELRVHLREKSMVSE